jgi:hypothetical protein
MRIPSRPDPKQRVKLNRPRGTVIGDFANVVNNFFGDPNAGWYSVGILVTLLLILGSVWLMFILSKGPLTTSLTTPAPTGIPRYTSGLITLISQGKDAISIYAINPDGTRILLLKKSGASTMEILTVSPQQKNGLRYLAASYYMGEIRTVVVVSSDGKYETTISQGNKYNRVVYLPDNSLLAEIYEGNSIVYKRFAVDGSKPTPISTTQLTPAAP